MSDVADRFPEQLGSPRLRNADVSEPSQGKAVRNSRCDGAVPCVKRRLLKNLEGNERETLRRGL
jgi:hypothetical protein